MYIFTPNTLIESSKVNANFAEKVNNAKLDTTAGDLGGAYLDYVPTITCSSGTLTSYTLNLARYTKIGKTVIVNVDVTLTNVGTGSGQLFIPLPSTAQGIGVNGYGSEYALVGYSLIIVNSTTARAAITKYTGATCIINNHRFGITIIYEEV